jgi:hypothetical protein
MFIDRYILDGHTAIAEPDLLKWAAWIKTAKRTVRKDIVGDSEVSTVFLGVDHSFGGRTPILFETMVFGGQLAGEQDRCSTWDEAERMHEAMIVRVKAFSCL